jgi:autotransporter-associated beta strand protein
MVPLIPGPTGTTRQSFNLTRPASGTTPGYVKLEVNGNAGNLQWTGANGAIWDLATTPGNWSGADPDTFSNLDLVTFADGGAGTVTLSGTLQPARITVSNGSTVYTFAGNGQIGGAPRLVKNGGGTLVIGNTTANTFSGGTAINAGTIELANTTGLLGSGPITLNGGTLRLPNAATFLSNSVIVSGSASIVSPYSGNSTILNSTSATLGSTSSAMLNFSGVSGILSINGRMDGFSGTIFFGGSSGMLRLNSNSSGANDVNTGSGAAHFDLGSAGATLNNRNGDITIHLGAVSGGAATHLNGRQSGSGATSTTYIIGELGLSTTFAGSIFHAGDLGGLHLIKTGAGTWNLTGFSSFTGTATVEEGILAIGGSTTTTGNAVVTNGAKLSLVAGSFGAESLTVQGGLSGHGTLAADLNSRGTVTGRGFAGGEPGTISIAGSAFFAGDSVLQLRAGATTDTIAVANDLSLGGSLQVSIPATPGFGRYVLLTYGGALSGNLALLPIPGGLPAHLSTSVPGEIALVIDDSDEDHLPDSWELASFDNLSQSGSGDADGDGSPNLVEYRLGLDAASGADFFKAAVDGRTLTWPSSPGVVFTVARSSTLDGEWLPIGTVTGGEANTASFTDPDVFGRAFYRISFTP